MTNRPDAGESPQWPWRATFAHWVLGLISPWLSLTPCEEPEYDDGPDQRELDSAYDAGMERGYNEAKSEWSRHDDW